MKRSVVIEQDGLFLGVATAEDGRTGFGFVAVDASVGALARRRWADLRSLRAAARLALRRVPPHAAQPEGGATAGAWR